jgi:hypothetical protein
MAGVARRDEMTDTVRQPAVEANGKKGASAVDAASNLLPLKGDEPITVYVRATFDPDGKQIAEFACDPNGEWYSGGLSWKSQHNALFVTFSLDTSVTGIKCDLPYSPVFGPTLASQLMCILPAYHARVVYGFWVSFPNNPPHDPKIVVSPINN